MEKGEFKIVAPLGFNAHKLSVLYAQLLDELPVHLQIQDVQAQITKAKFDALIKVGFNKDEALFLCK